MPQSQKKNLPKDLLKTSKVVKKVLQKKKIKLLKSVEIPKSPLVPKIDTIPSDSSDSPKVVSIKKASVHPPELNSVPVKFKKWVCIELTLAGEKEKRLHLLVKSVNQILRTTLLEVFIPAITQKVRDESSVLAYMEGYIFAEYKEILNYMRLQETNYFKLVLMRPSYEGRRKKMVYSLLTDMDMVSLRKGVDSLNSGNFKPGDIARVIKGNFKGLNAEVIEVIDESIIQVYVDLKSKKTILDFPPTYLVKV